MPTQERHRVNKDFDNMCIVRLAVLIAMALMMSIYYLKLLIPLCSSLLLLPTYIPSHPH